MKKIFLSALWLIVAVVVTINAEGKTNFVLFIADDCTYWDLGCYGSADSKTPNIDNLANQGMMFTKCYQAAPMCSPTRNNLLTGQYPVKTGAYPNHTFVKEGTESIVQFMAHSGYRMALAGKRHIAPREVFNFEYLDNSMELNLDSVDNFLADVSTKEDPFCLFLCSRQPHGPWDKGNPDNFDPESLTLPPVFVDTRETREAYGKYLAEVEYMDGQVGHALELLKKYGLEDETVFVFTSEQGSSFPFAKWTCYNAGLHTAFIVRWPGKVKPGSESGCLIDYSDVVPTFLDIANITIPKQIDGKSIKNILLGDESSVHKKYSFGLQTTRGINSGSPYYGIRSVTDGQYRYIINLTPEEVFKNGVTEGNSPWWLSWVRESEKNEKAKKLVYNFQHRSPVELYDEINDPFNQYNLIDKDGYEKISKELREALTNWMKECGDEGQQTELEAIQHQTAGRRQRHAKESKINIARSKLL